MRKNIEQIFFFSFIVFFLTPVAFAAEGSEVGTWYGYAYTDNARAANGTYIAAHLNASSSAVSTIRVGVANCLLANCTGFYYINVQANTSYNVTFKICGVTANTTAPTWSAGTHSHLDIYINKSATTASCTYSCGCSGGRCCSGATEYTDGSGTGTCQASACTAPSGATETVVSGGGAPAAGAVTTTTVAKATTTTTVVPPVEETSTAKSIEAGETTAFTYTTEGLGVTEISVQVANAVSNAQIKVTKTATQPATIAIAAPDNVYAYLQIEKTNLKNEDITSATIKFKVEKSWVTSNNIDLTTIILNRYVDGAWTSLPTTLTSSDDNYYYFEVTSPGLSVFAVTAKKVAVATTTTTTAVPPITIPTITTEWVVIVLAVLIAVGVLIFVWRKKSLSRKPVF